MSKICKKCFRELSIAEFYRDPEMADGHLNHCKACTKNRVKKYRDTHRELVNARDRKRYYDSDKRQLQCHRRKKEDSEKALERLHAARRRFPEKYNARTVVGNALRDGLLIKKACSVCGAPAQAHHEDYSKPLEINWLCPSHHGFVHRKGISPILA